MYLLKLQMHKHGNSIYFTRDNMVCFPKSGHIYIKRAIYNIYCPAIPFDPTTQSGIFGILQRWLYNHKPMIFYFYYHEAGYFQLNTKLMCVFCMCS